MEPELEVMLPQAKEGQEWPTGHHKLGERHGTDSLSEGTNAANNLISGFQAPER